MKWNQALFPKTVQRLGLDKQECRKKNTQDK